MIQAGWYPDPEVQSLYRYWNGNEWVGEPKTEEEVLRSTKSNQISETKKSGTIPQPENPKIGLFGAKKAAKGLYLENAELKKELALLRDAVDKYGISDEILREKSRANLQMAIQDLQVRRDEYLAEERHLKDEVLSLRRALVDLRSQSGLQEAGLYDFEHPAENSVDLAGELERVRSEIKKTISDKAATQATSNFQFNNSLREGQKFVRDMSSLLLRAYNAEAENCVKGAKAGNEEANVKRLETAMKQIERQGKMINLSITPKYHRLRLKEIEIASRYLKVLAFEKEAERERRAQIREDAKVARELEQEMKKLTDNQQMLEATLAKAEANGDLEAVERTLARIEDVKASIENVNALAANRRMGHVYVISNIGAFGKDVVKIGMTRRMDPLDRVRELGDASVPFRFDVHAMIFSDDAVGLETSLHRKFEKKRINKINSHREFFRVTPAEVLDELREENVVVVSYVVEPEAAEYRASMGELDLAVRSSFEDDIEIDSEDLEDSE